MKTLYKIINVTSDNNSIFLYWDKSTSEGWNHDENEDIVSIFNMSKLGDILALQSVIISMTDKKVFDEPILSISQFVSFLKEKLGIKS